MKSQFILRTEHCFSIRKNRRCVLYREVKVKLTLGQATKCQRGGRGTSLFFLQPRRQMGVGGQRYAPPHYPWRKLGTLLYLGQGRTHGRSYSEVVTVYCKNHMKHNSTVSQSAQFFV